MRLFTNDFSKSYSIQCRVALIAFLLELPNLVLCAVNAIFANTLVVWADCAQSLGATLHCFIVFLVARMLKKDTGDRFNFGIERFESFISLLCDALLFMSYLSLIGIAVIGIINPSQPDDSLGFFLVLKLINIAFDFYLVISQKKALNARRSRLTETEYAKQKDELLHDIIIGIVVCICFFLRSYEWSWYFSPAFTIILCLFFVVGCVKRLKQVIADLSDVSLSIEEQDGLMDIILDHASEIKKIYSVDCRTMNHKLHVDVHLSFSDDTTYDSVQSVLAKIEKSILELYPDAVTRIVIQNDAVGPC